jgi:hypothetical protein
MTVCIIEPLLSISITQNTSNANCQARNSCKICTQKIYALRRFPLKKFVGEQLLLAKIDRYSFKFVAVPPILSQTYANTSANFC